MSAPPAQLGDYLLGEQLGAGGMGTVHRGEHVGTGAEYALKLMPLRDDPQLTLRFQREAQAQAALGSHPNLARIHAFGVEGGWLYLVQELVPGGDLESRLRRGPLPADEARALVVGVGRGLAHAHEHGILHRDLKPANVLLDPDGRPRLVDFGLARIAGERSLTATGEVLGSPNWMAPEQALGEAVDERTDVYGLGAVLYHCLTGRPPIEGSTLLGVLDRVVSQAPPTPRSLVSRVPADLEAVCLRAMAKRPADRYPTVADLVAALTGDGAVGGLPRRVLLPAVIATAAVVAVAAIVELGVGVSRDRPKAAVPAEPSAVATQDERSKAVTPRESRWRRFALDDRELWAAARAGDRGAAAVLGRRCLAARRPVDAARWLKRAGSAPWLAERATILAWANDQRSKPEARRDLFDLAWILLTPLRQAYPTPDRFKIDAPDVQAAKRVLGWAWGDPGQQTGSKREREEAAGLLRYLEKKPVWRPVERALVTPWELRLKPFPIFDIYVLNRALELCPGPPAARQRLTLKVATLCIRRLPARALALLRGLLREPTLTDRDRIWALSYLSGLLSEADPDLRAPEEQTRAAWEGAGLGSLACVERLAEQLRLQRQPPAVADLHRLRRALSTLKGDVARIQLSLAEAYLRERTKTRRLVAANLLRSCAPALCRPEQGIAVLRRLFEAWAATDQYAPGFAERFRRVVTGAEERGQILLVLKGSGLEIE